MNDLTELDLAKARRALESAGAPTFSLADAIAAARERLRCGLGTSKPLDPETRPRDHKGQMAWDALQSAKARMIAYDAQPQTSATPSAPPPEQMSEAELRERIAALKAARRGTR